MIARITNRSAMPAPWLGAVAYPAPVLLLSPWRGRFFHALAEMLPFGVIMGLRWRIQSGQSWRMSEAYLIPVSDRTARPGYITRRCLAFGIDMMLASAVGWILLLFILVFGILTLGLGFLMLHVLPWVPLVYLAVFIGGTGATPGQRICGIAVRQESGAMPNMAQGLVFSILLLLSLALAGLPLLLALAGPRHRAAHDLLSGLMITRPGY